MDTFRPRYQVPFDEYEPALIEWDADEEIIHIPNDSFVDLMDYDDQDDQHLHRRENFVDYDIILDHHILKGQHGSLLTAAAGRLAFGTVGAIAGYWMGAKPDKKLCSRMSLVLFFTDGKRVERIDLIHPNVPVEYNSFQYDPKFDNLKECICALEAFKLANSGREDVSQSEINDIAADVIYKLNNLIMGEYDT